MIRETRSYFTWLRYMVNNGWYTRFEMDLSWFSKFSNFSGDTNIAKLLIKEGADVNAKDITGWTPLHHASLSGNLCNFMQLIEIICLADFDRPLDTVIYGRNVEQLTHATFKWKQCLLTLFPLVYSNIKWRRSILVSAHSQCLYLI